MQASPDVITKLHGQGSFTVVSTNPALLCRFYCEAVLFRVALRNPVLFLNRKQKLRSRFSLTLS